MRTAWQLTKDIWLWYLKHFKAVAKVALWWLAALVFTLPGAILSLGGLTASGEVISRTPEHFEVFLFFAALGTVGSVVAAAFVRPALIATIYAHLKGKNIAPLKAFSHARGVFWHYILVMALTGLAVGAGFFAFFFPGIVLAAYLLFSEQAVVLEDERHVNAMKRSWGLVRGRFWATLWRFFLPSAVFWLGTAGLTTLLVQAPLAGFSSVAGLGPDALRYVVAPFMILAAIISALTMPLFIAVQVFLFEDLRKNPAAGAA